MKSICNEYIYSLLTSIQPILLAIPSKGSPLKKKLSNIDKISN